MIRLSMKEEHPTDEYGQMGLFPADEEFRVGDMVWWNGNISWTQYNKEGKIFPLYNRKSKIVQNHPEDFPKVVSITYVGEFITGYKAYIIYPFSFWVWPEALQKIN
jgi:hypothetical protein